MQGDPTLKRRERRVRRRIRIVVATLGIGLVGAAIGLRHEVLEKRVSVVEPGRLVRGAWQRPWPLSRLIDREAIRTIVTLTAINETDPKYVGQKAVVDRSGVGWELIPMRGSTATLEQLAEAADLLDDPARQPVFFHCVAGHHRTNLVMAAYRIRCRGWSVDRAWNELCSFAWTDPENDRDDRRLLDAFARSPFGHPGSDEPAAGPIAPPADTGGGDGDRRGGGAAGMEVDVGQFRRR